MRARLSAMEAARMPSATACAMAMASARRRSLLVRLCRRGVGGLAALSRCPPLVRLCRRGVGGLAALSRRAPLAAAACVAPVLAA